MMKKKGYAKGGMKKKGYAKGGLKPAPNKGAASLPKAVRNKMGFMNKGGMPKKKGYGAGGLVISTGTLNTGIRKTSGGSTKGGKVGGKK